MTVFGGKMYSDDAGLIEEIMRLKEKRKAILLVHNYQLGEVQDIADYTGDSLELSRIASQTDSRVIVFCGVHFMAETASILCPDKTVLLPDINAGCPMADMINAGGLRALMKEYPNAPAIAYVNTSAEVKAEAFICCTSTNAVRVAESVDSPEVIFVPDKYLAHYTSSCVKKKFIIWDGYCPTHIKIIPEDILRERALHPQAEVMVHPECTPAVAALADRVVSTGGMCKFAKESSAKEFIIGTEIGMLHRLRKENPDKTFYPASELAICPNMKKINLEKVRWSLQDMKNEIKVPEEIRLKAKSSVDRMLAVK